MLPDIYKVIEVSGGTLSVMAKPVAGEWIEDEFSGLRKLGVTHVVSLLESDEAHEVGLRDEKSLCEKNGICFTSFPIQDRGLPNKQKAIELIQLLYSDIMAGGHVVIHCRAGIGRTGIIAGGVLLQMGYSDVDALKLISAKRGVSVPDTDEQEQWLGAL
jgi:protein-tyrosine phosphatase